MFAKFVRQTSKVLKTFEVYITPKLGMYPYKIFANPVVKA
jgi:hypothetical protein